MPEKLNLGESKEKGLESGFSQVRNGGGGGRAGRALPRRVAGSLLFSSAVKII